MDHLRKKQKYANASGNEDMVFESLPDWDKPQLTFSGNITID